MCGIAGIMSLSNRAPRGADLAPMLAALAHRGPDGEGVYLGDGIALGHRRLAVIDAREGAQPFEVDGHVVTTGGEMYDHPEERRRLSAEGVEFRTRSDTEVLVRLLAREGVESLRNTHGMYAFAWWDEREGQLTLARDRFGMKPLLLVRDGERGEVRFASELGALFAGRRPPRLDRDALLTRLAFQIPLAGRPLVAGVTNVPPGHALSIGRDGRAVLRSVHAPIPEEEEGGTDAEWAARLREEIARAVRGACRADVPVGVCLSGGLDSSLVSALAAKSLEGPVPAFTGYFEEGPAFDEREHARRAAGAIGLDLVPVPVRPADLLSKIGALAAALEGPIAGPGALPQYVVAARAAEQVGVVLTGQGGDEIFGGYARHRIAWLEARGRLDPDALPPGLEAYRPLVDHLLADGVGEAFADRFFRLVYRGDGLSDLLGPALRRAWEGYDAREAFRETFRSEGGDEYRKMTRFERQRLLPALLHVEDRVTMAHALESRAPLLSPRVLDLVARIPCRVAFGAGESKRILRLAARGVAPESALSRRDKMGFPVPLGRWARGPLREALMERLVDGPLVAEGLLDPDAPAKLLDRAGGHGRHLWFFLCLSEWMRTTGVRP